MASLNSQHCFQSRMVSHHNNEMQWQSSQRPMFTTNNKLCHHKQWLAMTAPMVTTNIDIEKRSPQATTKHNVSTNNELQWQRLMVTTNNDWQMIATNGHHKQWLYGRGHHKYWQRTAVRHHKQWKQPMITIDKVTTQWQQREANTKNDSHWQLPTVITNSWMTATGGHHV